jgi:DNA-binding XRE family transcriptional regulator
VGDGGGYDVVERSPVDGPATVKGAQQARGEDHVEPCRGLVQVVPMCHGHILRRVHVADTAGSSHTEVVIQQGVAEERRLRLGAALRELRHRRGLSQQQVADMAGVDRKSVVRVEAGQYAINIDRLWLLADSLSVSLTELAALAETGGSPPT